MAAASRRLYAPRPARVEADRDRVPLAVDGVAVAAVREQWRVEDRWWTERELRRSYFELALADGNAVVVFHSETSGRWGRQRA